MPSFAALEEPRTPRKRSSGRDAHPPLRSEASLQLGGNFCHPLHPGCGILSKNWHFFCFFFKEPQVHRIELFTLLSSWHTEGQCKTLLVFYHLASFLILNPVSLPFSNIHSGVLKERSLLPTLHKFAYMSPSKTYSGFEFL